MRRTVWVLAFIALGSASAGTLLDQQSTLTVSLQTVGTLVVQLEKGAQGTVTVSSTKTGVTATVDANVIVDTAYNTTYVNNTSADPARVRLVFVASSGPIANCAVCDLELRRGASNSAQIQIRDGAVTLNNGEWQSLSSQGNFGSVWHLFAVAKRVLVPEAGTLVVDYQLEVVSDTSTSANAHYTKMRMRYSF